MHKISIDEYVRIRPNGANPHHAGGQVKAISGDEAHVLPLGGKQAIWIPIKRLRPWAARNHRAEEVRRKRVQRASRDSASSQRDADGAGNLLVM
jgi:hypothetical protein